MLAPDYHAAAGLFRNHTNNGRQLGEIDTDPKAVEATPPAPIAAAQDSSWPQRLRVIAITVLLLGYAALSQYSASSANAHAKTVGAALSVAPVLVMVELATSGAPDRSRVERAVVPQLAAHRTQL
jgi:hypothetical protein